MLSIVVHWINRFVVVNLVVAGTLFAVGASASAAGWLRPVSAPASAWSVDAQDVALDAQGNAVAVWTANGSDRKTQAATRPVGGAWSAPVTLSPDGEYDDWDPAVAVGANGDAVAVWSSVRNSSGWTRQIVLSSSREAGGQWSEPIALSDTVAIAISYEPDVVVDADGNATAIWSEETGSASAVHARTRPKGGEWGPPVELTDSLVTSTPRLAVDPQGDVTAVWNWNVPERGSGTIQSSIRPAGGPWSAEPVDVSGDEAAVEPQLAVDAHGNAVAVWHRFIGFDSVVRAAWRVAGSGWGAAVDLSRGDLRGSLAQVAIDGDGTATAVWESYDASGTVIRSSSSAVGGAWSDPVDVSVRDDGPWPGSFPQVAVGPQGDATAIWRAWYADRFNIVLAARREAGGAWGAPVELGASNGVIEPRPVAVDPQGYVTAVWARGRNLQSAVFDAVAPLLSDVAVPLRGVAGQPVAMSAGLFDRWSPVTARWDFGDGRSGTGTAVRHCFGTPGQRTVTVTATDGAANVANASRTIAIEPDPAVPQGRDPCEPPDPGPPGPRPPGPGPPVPIPPDPVPPGPGPPAPPDPDTTAPVVSGLKQSGARWRTRNADRGSRLPVGTTFRFRVDRAARVQLAFSQVASGRRAGGRCVKVTRVNRGRPPCSRSLSRGALELTGRAGANAVAFRGRVRGRTLAPGRYRLSVTALAGGRRSSAVSVAFTIAR